MATPMATPIRESFRDAAVDHAKHGDDTSVVVVKTVED